MIFYWRWEYCNLYTKVLFIFYQNVFFSRKVPTVKDIQLKDMQPKKQLKKETIAYALNISVPLGTEDEYDGVKGMQLSSGRKIVQWVEENMWRLPMYDVKDGGNFAEGENPVEYSMKHLGRCW